MNNRELKYIIEEIEEKEPLTLQEIAAKAKVNRSHLSTLKNMEEVKDVSDRLVAKIKKQFPAYFSTKPTNQQNQQTIPDHIYVEKYIAEKEARRIEAMALADKMEAHYKDMVAALERAQLTINEVLKPIKEKTEEILINSNTTLDRLSLVETIIRSDDTVIMNNQDRQIGYEVGKSAKEAGSRQLAADKMRKGKGNQAGVNKPHT